MNKAYVAFGLEQIFGCWNGPRNNSVPDVQGHNLKSAGNLYIWVKWPPSLTRGEKVTRALYSPVSL